MSPDRIDPAALDDDELLDVVARVLAATDPVPPAVIAGALGAETWRTVDAELAELVFDSALEATGTRSAPASPAARELTFRAGDLEVEVLVLDSAAVGLEGQVVPPDCDLVELVSMGDDTAARTAPVDDLGRFRFTSIPAGPVRLGVHLHSGWVHTSWLVLRPSP